MAETQTLSAAEIAYLAPFLPSASSSPPPPDRPFVTLTYASSLDSMLSLAPGTRTTLSGAATKALTHYLRLQHDAILVGVGTAIPDDPGLNSRYPGATLDAQPQPVVLDPRGRWNPAGSKLEQLARQGVGKEVWIVREASEQQGVGREIYLPAARNEGFEWREILHALRSRGVQSVMIEGGAKVISALLARPELVDVVIVTLAPTWLGVGGVVVAPAAARSSETGERVNAARLEGTAWRQFGQDVVCCGRLEGR
nr:2,5-diamino-6-ribosylamino-4(3h)-pyrimidinone 5'-phosphate reductase [Quercus suber]